MLRTALFALPLLLAATLTACGGDQTDVTIVALTRTPAPPTSATSESTAISPGTPTAGTATPGPEASVQLPAAPENLLVGGTLVAAYLAGGRADSAGCLPELVEAWGLGNTDGARCATGDIDGDRRDEFVFLLTVPAGEPPYAGEVWFFQSDDEDYRLFASARQLVNEVIAGVQIVSADDFTGDGSPDIVVSWQWCDASRCVTDLLVASAHRGTLENLAPDDAAVEALESITVEDVTGDSRLDLVLVAGGVTSPGAGPPRRFTRTLSWSGLRFFVVDVPDLPDYVFHALVDADAAFAAADYAAARQLHFDAARDRTLEDWKLQAGNPPGREELVPYALFRAGLAALRGGDSSGALLLFAQAVSGHESSLHGVAAATYLAALTEGRTPLEACSAMETYLQTRAADFARAWDYGFANPEHSITAICR